MVVSYLNYKVSVMLRAVVNPMFVWLLRTKPRTNWRELTGSRMFACSKLISAADPDNSLFRKTFSKLIIKGFA
mgnify:FL=1|jgi:hypothetical protein